MLRLVRLLKDYVEEVNRLEHHRSQAQTGPFALGGFWELVGGRHAFGALELPCSD